MYLKYGNYQHAAGEASVVITRQTLYSAGGISRGYVERWNIQGQLFAPNAGALNTAIDALLAAYATPGQDVGFYFDNGSASSHRLRSADTNGGVRVVAPPSFPEGRGAEYTTFRHYTIGLEAEWIDPQATLLSWHEVLQFQGGGPRFAYLEPIVGQPVKQLIQQATSYRVTQSGEAVGCRGYPLPAAPLWPQAEHRGQRQLRYELPKRAGPAGNPTLTEFKVSWSYSFEDAGPLVGLPTASPV